MSIAKRNVILTFDYEVFLGKRTGSINNCVINPTNLILEILNKYNAKSIFFVDASWLLFLKEKTPDDFKIVTEQLRSIVDSGSSVELHLHPQWLDANISAGKISFSTLEHYRLQSLQRKDLMDLFENAIELLQSITKQKVTSFRAGGWCIQPFEKLRVAFKKYDIKYDSSVLPGMSLKDGREYDYDFINVKEQNRYKFERDIEKPEITGSIIEYPVSTYRNNPIYRIVNKLILKLKKDHIYGDGTGSKPKSIGKTLVRSLKFSREKLTIDRRSFLIFRCLLAIHFRKSSHLVVVSHPKLISKQALKNLTYLVESYSTVRFEK